MEVNITRGKLLRKNCLNTKRNRKMVDFQYEQGLLALLDFQYEQKI